MSFLRQHSRLLLVAVSCLALGAGASAIATAGAATSAAHARGHHGLRGAVLRRVARHAVQGSVLLATRTGFVTVNFDRGRVASVSGHQLTITEGNARTAQRTVTLTIPATARVRDNHHVATLSALQAGQRVIVIRTPKRTLVIAHTARLR
jgi:hypothetical protein